MRVSAPRRRDHGSLSFSFFHEKLFDFWFLFLGFFGEGGGCSSDSRIYMLPDEASLFACPKFNYYKDPNLDERWIRPTDFTESCSVGEASAFCHDLPPESNLPNVSKMFAFHKEVTVLCDCSAASLTPRTSNSSP